MVWILEPGMYASFGIFFKPIASELGWSRAQAASLLSVSERVLETSQRIGFESDSIQSQTQLVFIRMYHLLYALSDGDTDEMQCWLKRYHNRLRAIPILLCDTLDGLEQVSRCLESELNHGMDDRWDHVLPISLSHWE
ncbi:MAG: hypothetical protein CMF17_11410 [Idiomarinaceae bacterium]|nr:hypothetical protein [Idiomarinaceae bacterium]